MTQGGRFYDEEGIRRRNAVRMAGGELPAVGTRLVRLTRWGKNHHVDATGERTFCGLDVGPDALPVDWARRWCVRCTKIGRYAKEEDEQ